MFTLGSRMLHRRHIFGGLIEAVANIERHQKQQRGCQERDPPAPAQQRRLRQIRHQKEGQRREHDAHDGCRLEEGGEIATPVERDVFGDECDRTGIFGAGAKSLQQAKGNQQDRRPDPDLAEIRQQPHGHGRQAHQCDREDERRLAPEPIADVRDDDSPERPGKKADGKGGKGRQHAAERRQLRKE